MSNYHNVTKDSAGGAQIRDAAAKLYEVKSHLEQAAGIAAEVLAGGGTANQEAVYAHFTGLSGSGNSTAGQAIHDQIANLNTEFNKLFDGGTVTAQGTYIDRFNPGT